MSAEIYVVLACVRTRAARNAAPLYLHGMMELTLAAALLGFASAAENGLVAGGGSVTVYEGPTEVRSSFFFSRTVRVSVEPESWTNRKR